MSSRASHRRHGQGFVIEMRQSWRKLTRTKQDKAGVRKNQEEQGGEGGVNLLKFPTFFVYSSTTTMAKIISKTENRSKFKQEQVGVIKS